MPRLLKVATVCLRAECSVEANRIIFLRYLEAAKAEGAQLVLFPEVALQQNPGWGYLSHVPTEAERAYVAQTAEPIPGPSCDWLQAHLQRLELAMLFGMTERGDDGRLYNTAVLLGPEGIWATYRKSCLWDDVTGGNEHCFWSLGAVPGLVVETPLGRLGLMICVEMSLGYGKLLGERGAQVLTTVSAWTGDHGELFEHFVRQSAIESGCPHVIANQGGAVGQTWDWGHSRIVAADGSLLASTGRDEGMVVASVALKETVL